MNKKERGITLIALIITVIVLLILAGTAVSIAVNGGDIFGKATEAKEDWNAKVAEEEQNIIEVLQLANGITTGNNGGVPTPILSEIVISKEVPTNHESEFVGKYADVDGNDTIDGIIYVDLLVQAGTTRQWHDEYGEYSIPSSQESGVTAETVKDYVISQTSQTDARFDNTARDVVKLATSQTNSNPVDRFYVMALEDIKDSSNNTELFWYYNAYDEDNYEGKMYDYATYTSEAFGKGRENTTKMLTKWESNGYGEQNDKDMWKWINVKPGQANEGWFVPSRAEWSAFGQAFDINGSNYTSFGVAGAYWSSSQSSDDDNAWWAHLLGGWMSDNGLVNEVGTSVRLSTTF